uniref:Uncharacterized protein n=1 Tax=Cacopsylla melanoneura TaxID=428564 RepID=A0A8D8TW05_9HEMI
MPPSIMKRNLLRMLGTIITCLRFQLSVHLKKVVLNIHVKGRLWLKFVVGSIIAYLIYLTIGLLIISVSILMTERNVDVLREVLGLTLIQVFCLPSKVSSMRSIRLLVS